MIPHKHLTFAGGTKSVSNWLIASNQRAHFCVLSAINRTKTIFFIAHSNCTMVKVKVSPTTGRRDGQRGSGQVNAPDFLTFGTTRVVGRQLHAPATFTPRGIPGTHFLEAELTPGHMVLSVSTRKIPVIDATGIRSQDGPASSTVP